MSDQQQDENPQAGMPWYIQVAELIPVIVLFALYMGAIWVIMTYAF